MCHELTLENINTGQQRIFENVNSLVVPGYDVRHFSAISKLMSKPDVDRISFKHSKGEISIKTSEWKFVHLIS